LVLPYNENTLDVLLNTNELYNPKKIKLFFSIDNVNYIPVTNNVIHLTNLSSDKYTLKIKIKDLLNGTTQIKPLLNFKIKSPFWFTYWFWGFVLFITGALFVLIYKYNVSKFKEREQIKSNLTKRIAETKLEALQSQMNPHFTFNAMSSIQNYVIDNDIDKALMYIGEFSRLMRKTLDNSSETFISLADEIAYLKTYISLENMRFDNLIEVSILSEGINTDDVFVPPMLIQPLIENSFNHAFKKENHSHQLLVNFIKQNSFILCEVIDNGVGINKLTKTPEHTSKAMKIIKERLSFLSSLSVEELVTVISSSEGTVIKILIPTG
jgi:sensor histidine kinase YesM